MAALRSHPEEKGHQFGQVNTDFAQSTDRMCFDRADQGEPEEGQSHPERPERQLRAPCYKVCQWEI